MRELRPKEGKYSFQRQGFVDFCEWATTGRDNNLYIEVGSWQGESAEIAAGYFEKVICIDPWSEAISKIKPQYGYDMDEVYKAFLLRTALCRNVEAFRITSIEGAMRFRHLRASVVYIDGSHMEPNVIADMRAWWPIVADNGIMAGHDFDIIGVKNAINVVFDSEPDKTFKDNSWAFDKTSFELGRKVNL